MPSFPYHILLSGAGWGGGHVLGQLDGIRSEVDGERHLCLEVSASLQKAVLRG